MNIRWNTYLISICLASSTSIADGMFEGYTVSSGYRASIHAQIGDNYLKGGDFRSAIKEGNLAILYDKGYFGGYSVIAQAYERLFSYRLAEFYYRKAIFRSPKSFVYNNYGHFLCRYKRIKLGIYYIQLAIKNPTFEDYPKAISNMGDCYFIAKNNLLAEKYYKLAIVDNYHSEPLLFNYSNALFLNKKYLIAKHYLDLLMNIRSKRSPKILYLGYKISKCLGNYYDQENYENILSTDFPESQEYMMAYKDLREHNV